MRALTELLIVFVAAFFGFFALLAALLANLVGFLVIAVAGFFSAASLLIALFAGLGFALTGSHHDAGLAVAYSLYAAASFRGGRGAAFLPRQAPPGGAGPTGAPARSGAPACLERRPVRARRHPPLTGM